MYHLRKVIRLVDELKGFQQMKRIFRVPLAKIRLIVGWRHLDSNGDDGNFLVDQYPARLLAANVALYASGPEPPVGRELLPGYGFIPGNADQSGKLKFQERVLVKIEIVDPDIE